MTRAGALGGIASALLTFWGLVGLADRPKVSPALQPLPAATEAPQQMQAWQQPDPRTLQRFPGP